MRLHGAVLTLTTLPVTLALCLAAAPGALAADPDAPETLVPIGGGYSVASLEGFALEVADQATGDTVDLVVVPSSYGDAPEDREDNLMLAQRRADEIETACDAVVDFAAFPGGCVSTVVPLLTRGDALDPANSAVIRQAGTDGIYVLGGDQVLAMQVLANTPAEEAMEDAFTNGVVVGGTSAGNAVDSRSMGAGYPDAGYPWNALERDMTLIAWGDDLASEERGLSFGSKRVILDQHFYERGRFGRLVSWVGQSMEKYGGTGKLGVGVDWGTAVVIEDDARLTRPFGASSTAVLDASQATTPQWVGPRQTLSLQGLLTHLMAPGTGMTYDIVTRSAMLDGAVVAVPQRQALPTLNAKGALWLGGGDNAGADSAVLEEFVSAAHTATRGKGKKTVLVLATGYVDSAAAEKGAGEYVDGLRAHGWTGGVQVVIHGIDALRASDVARATGILVVGGDQSLMGEEVVDATVRKELSKALNRGTAVMTDGAATAIMGERYVTDADPATADDAIEMFRTDAVGTAVGLGLVPGYAVEPTLTYDYRWGRLYGAAHADPGIVSLGISELTAVRLERNRATVVGQRSAVAVDGSAATWLEGRNGALGAVNVWMDVFAVGDQVG